MTGSGPLGRDSVPFRETMERYHGEIERLTYAAEIACPAGTPCDPLCPFADSEDTEVCKLAGVRYYIGNPVEQHDAMPGVPPVPPRRGAE